MDIADWQDNYKENNVNKNYKLINEIVNKYHPSFKNNPEYQKFALEFHDVLNVERLVEYTLAEVGGYNFVDEVGRDFDCAYDSDSKTVTVVNNGGKQQCRVMIIGSVENKIGSLRVTVYNPFKDEVDFMYIPKDDVPLLMENDGTRGTANYSKKRIRANWSWSSDSYNKLEKYRISSFEELAKAQG